MADQEFATLPPDPYKVLGVSRDAQLPEIRSACRKLVLKCHPDKYPDPEVKNEKAKEFKLIEDAYDILINETRRAAYDDRVNLAKLRAAQNNSNDSAKLYDEAGRPLFREWKQKGDTENVQQGQEKKTQGLKTRASSGILVAQGIIDGTHTYAIPDTGAECNIITASFAAKLKLRVRRHKEGDKVRLRAANGRFIVTRGTVQANWQFETETSRTFRVTFHILNEFMYDLVLGNAFLMKTGTMSHRKDRLSRIPRPADALSVLRVNLLGQTSQRVRGNVRTSDVLALPDSGSEPNLLSWRFVKEKGLENLVDWENERLLQFADGSLGRTEGSIWTRWEFASNLRSNGTGIEVEFHVSRDCVYDVIIGQDVLEETDAFLNHEEDFIYVESDPEFAGMNLVIFAPKKAKKSSSPQRVHDALYTELQRLAKADDEIRRLSKGTIRGGAHSQEEIARRTYNERSRADDRRGILPYPQSPPPQPDIHANPRHGGDVRGSSISHTNSSISNSFTRRESPEEYLRSANATPTPESYRHTGQTQAQQIPSRVKNPVTGNTGSEAPNRNNPNQIVSSGSASNIEIISSTSSSNGIKRIPLPRTRRPEQDFFDSEITSEFYFNMDLRKPPAGRASIVDYHMQMEPIPYYTGDH
ncbi:hypothetical protein F5Y00DRAFT_238604, partial [Daldinia vernicosa]|uniref:uncharacterized protein n=1 Tax=Daldinia vernicosa TaxID=114800 RepID=UPI002008D958